MIDIIFFESVHPAIVEVNVAGHMVAAGSRTPETALRTKYRIYIKALTGLPRENKG
jgi:hypothetical protein